jgi:hypothetical protein
VTGVWDLGRQSITGEDSRLLLDAPLACVFLGAQLLAFGPAVGALVDFFPLGRAVYCRMPILLTT